MLFTGLRRPGIDHRGDQPGARLPVPQEALAARGARGRRPPGRREYDRLTAAAEERERLRSSWSRPADDRVDGPGERRSAASSGLRVGRDGPQAAVAARLEVVRRTPAGSPSPRDLRVDARVGDSRWTEAAHPPDRRRRSRTCSKACGTCSTAVSRPHGRAAAARRSSCSSQNEVHLILSDQRMPGMSGDVFLSQARRLQPDAIRMLFTGYADIQAVINAVNEGHIFRYILKPWDAVELEGIIRQAAEQYELLAERKRLIAELQAANAQLTAGQRGAGRGRPAQDGVHRGRQPRVQHADHARPGAQRAAPAGRTPTATTQEREIVEQISASGRQLARLVTNMLTLMRAEDFRRTLQRSPVDLADLLREVVDQVRAVRQRPPAAARRRAAPTTWATFEIDADKIARRGRQPADQRHQVHARRRRDRACRPGSADDDEAEIEVADRGIGLEPRALSHLFQPFFTAVRPEPPFLGRFRLQQARAGPGPEHRQAVRRAARRPGLGRERPGRGDRGSRSACPATPRPARSAVTIRRTGRATPTPEAGHGIDHQAAPARRSVVRSRGTPDAHRPDRRGRARSQQAPGHAGPAPRLPDRLRLHRRRGPRDVEQPAVRTSSSST